jgi:hypothetical protein
MFNKVRDGRSVVAGTDARQMINVLNFDSLAVEDFEFSFNHFDCSNAANSTLQYGGIRLRNASGAKEISVFKNTFVDCLNAVRAATFGRLLIDYNIVRTGTRLFFASLGANGTLLRTTGNVCTGLTTNAVSITYNSFTLAQWINGGNSWEGTGTTFGTMTLGTNVLAATLLPDRDAMSTKTLLQRSGAASPAGSVTPLGLYEIYKNTTGPAYFMAMGLTSADWVQIG